MLHILCGWGKGKTTSAVGMVARMVGHGKSAMFAQFIKPPTSGEVESLKCLGVHCCHADDYTDSVSNAFLFSHIEQLTKSIGYDIIVLDEVLDAVEGGAITEEDLVRLIVDLTLDGTEIVLTGHYLPSKKVLGLSDYINLIVSEKHPFENGVGPREGIEF